MWTDRRSRDMRAFAEELEVCARARARTCACVRSCVRACTRLCVCVRVRVRVRGCGFRGQAQLWAGRADHDGRSHPRAQSLLQARLPNVP
jgi:hypothetical protein